MNTIFIIYISVYIFIYHIIYYILIKYISYYTSKIEELQIKIRDKMTNFERLKAQRNELNTKVKLMREELTQLHEPGSYIGS